MSLSTPSGMRRHAFASLRIVVAHAALLLLIVGALPSQAAFVQCNDGADNDYDGKIDYPQDDGCASLLDDSEGPTGHGLFVSVSNGVETVNPGDSFVYRIDLRSDRENPQTVDVNLLLPNQANILSISDAGRRVDTNIRWDKITVYPGILRTLTVQVQVSPYAKEGLLIIAELEAAGERATSTTRVVGEFERPQSMRLSITDGKDTVEPGQKLTHDIVVRNDGAADRVIDVRVTPPSNLSVLSTSGESIRNGDTVVWPHQLVPAGGERRYSVTTQVDGKITEFYALRMRAVTSDGITAVDTTYVLSRLLPTDLSVAIDPSVEQAMPGQEITYTIVVVNNQNTVGTHIDVSNALPLYTEFVSATEGGLWVGENVRWRDLTISPYGKRVLQATARVRKDAPIDGDLLASVSAEGMLASTHTAIVERTALARPGTSSATLDRVFLSKVADRAEVRPGGTVTYTIAVRNTTGHAISDLTVTDRLAPSAMQLIGGAQDAQQNGDALVWQIDALEPGQVWQRSYTVRIASTVGNGTELRNLVVVSGADIETMSLEERVRAYRTTVLNQMPKSGVAMDSMYVFITGLIGVGQVFALRRKQFLGF